MVFIPLSEVCPELAEEETMGIQVLPSPDGIVPAGAYSLIELFCSERGCDCRRVMFSVTEVTTDKMVALIHWGWDKWSFYREWLKFGDDDEVDELKGPSLDWNSPKTEVANEFLAIIRDDLVKEKDFKNTIKRHYKAFRKVIDKDNVMPLNNKKTPVRLSKANNASPEKDKSGGVDGFVLRIDLRHIKPPIWRRIWVPTDYTLHDLHRLIQTAMGWWNAHLHCFVINGIEYGEPDSEYCFTEVISEHETKLKDVIKRVKQKIRYDYDFGDDWEHDVVMERRERRDSQVPILLKGKRACPPEDCGGEYGYFRLIEVQKKAKTGEKLTEDQQYLLEWMDHEFDAEEFDAEAVNVKFAKMYG